MATFEKINKKLMLFLVGLSAVLQPVLAAPAVTFTSVLDTTKTYLGDVGLGFISVWILVGISVGLAASLMPMLKDNKGGAAGFGIAAGFITALSLYFTNKPALTNALGWISSFMTFITAVFLGLIVVNMAKSAYDHKLTLLSGLIYIGIGFIIVGSALISFGQDWGWDIGILGGIMLFLGILFWGLKRIGATPGGNLEKVQKWFKGEEKKEEAEENKVDKAIREKNLTELEKEIKKEKKFVVEERKLAAKEPMPPKAKTVFQASLLKQEAALSNIVKFASMGRWDKAEQERAYFHELEEYKEQARRTFLEQEE